MMHESPKDPSRFKPETKVVAGTAGGGGTALVLWIADQFGLDDMPQAVAAAIVTLAVLVAGWLAPHTHRDTGGEEA